MRACRGFCSVPGPLQTVQRAEFWCVILALQANDGVHLGVDNLGVVRHVGRLLDGKGTSRPAELDKDGDLILLIERMLRLRGLDTVRITKVKGHADEAMAQAGGVHELDRLVNNGADGAADFGRRRVHWGVVNAHRNFAGVCSRWRPVVLSLHLLFLAISMAVVHHDGEAGASMDPMIWSAGGIPKRREEVHAVGNRAFLPGPAGIWDGGWVGVAATPITCHDIEAWPHSVGRFVKCVAFLATLHWSQGEVDLGVGSVSFVEILILYELWAGERLDVEKAVPRYRRAGRSISVSAVPFGPGIDIWRSCRFIGALFRALSALPGGVHRFLPCGLGANHCRLRHIGWEKCGHGLTSRPREAALEGFLNQLLLLFGYPPRSAGVALL